MSTEHCPRRRRSPRAARASLSRAGPGARRRLAWGVGSVGSGARGVTQPSHCAGCAARMRTGPKSKRRRKRTVTLEAKVKGKGPERQTRNRTAGGLAPTECAHRTAPARGRSWINRTHAYAHARTHTQDETPLAHRPRRHAFEYIMRHFCVARSAERWPWPCGVPQASLSLRSLDFHCVTQPALSALGPVQAGHQMHQTPSAAPSAPSAAPSAWRPHRVRGLSL